jgi:hypothetical protein
MLQDRRPPPDAWSGVAPVPRVPEPTVPMPPGVEQLDWLFLAGSSGLGLAASAAAVVGLVLGLVASPGPRRYALGAAGGAAVLALAGALLAHLGHVDPGRDYVQRPFTKGEGLRFTIAFFFARALGACVTAGLVLALAYVAFHFSPPSGATATPEP